MAMSKRLRAIWEDAAKAEEERNRRNPPPPNPHEIERKKQSFDKIRSISEEILNNYFDHGCDRSKITELSTLAFSYAYMEIDRHMMDHHLKRYETFKGADKQKIEWEMVRYYVRRLYGFSTMHGS